MNESRSVENEGKSSNDPAGTGSEAAPEPSLRVLTSGSGWIAIDKASGLSAHNSDSTGEPDVLQLALRLLESSKELARASEWEGRNFPPAPVHRLDRETSGVMLLATRKQDATLLQRAFDSTSGERAAKKIYRAVLKGSLKAKPYTQIVWKWPLTDKSEGRRSPAGAAKDRKPAETIVRILRSNPYLTEIEVELITGRQHQIRRHAAIAGHPIVGDRRYGEPKHADTIRRLFGFDRLMLHAKKLELETEKHVVRAESSQPLEFDRLFEERK